MALIIADRVRELTTTAGTGTIYLGGAVSGFVAFGSVLPTGSKTYYAMIASNGSAWEVGVGTYTTVGNTLSRDTVLASSNSNGLVNFASGTKNVIITQPAERNVYLNDSGVVVSGDNGSNLTIANATLTAPTVTGGTLTGPTIATPTVTDGTFDGGTFNNPIIVGPVVSGGATFDTVTTTASTTAASNKGALNYGTLGFTDTGIVQSAQTSVNSYFQNVIQNTSNGTLASAEFIAYNDAGTASTNFAAFGINSSGYSGTGSINTAGYGYFITGSTDLVLGTIGSNKIHFAINSGATDAMLIDTTGAVGIGASTTTGYDLRVSKNITGATTAYGAAVDGTIQSDVTATANGYSTNVNTAVASFTLTNLNHYKAAQGTVGAGSTVTNQYGFVADATLVGATNNYGFFGGVPVSAGANRYNLYMSGTAPNYFSGGLEQSNTISSNYTITANTNSQWVTPLTISAIVTVPSTSSWTLI